MRFCAHIHFAGLQANVLNDIMLNILDVHGLAC